MYEITLNFAFFIIKEEIARFIILKICKVRSLAACSIAVFQQNPYK